MLVGGGGYAKIFYGFEKNVGGGVMPKYFMDLKKCWGGYAKIFYGLKKMLAG